MWMVGQGAGPGVQHTQAPDQPTDVMRIRGERDARVSRGAEQDVVQVFLVSADQRPQLAGQGEDDMTGGDRQAFLTPLFQPGFGVQARTRGTTPVAAGVVGVVFLATVIALEQLPASRLGAAVDQIVHGAAMTGQPALPKPVQGPRAHHAATRPRPPA